MDQDEGTFLSSIQVTDKSYDSQERKRLFMGDLFPEEWMGQKGKYDITVRAKRITDSAKKQSQEIPFELGS